MADTIQSVLIGGFAGLVSAVITHFSTRAKLRLDLAAEYDKKLQESRLEAYMKLWAMLEPLAKYGRDKVTFKTLQAISDSSRAWYFQTGGIYLTERSRKPYFDWKRELQELLHNKDLAAASEEAIKTELLDPLIGTGSTLRTALSDDIGPNASRGSEEAASGIPDRTICFLSVIGNAVSKALPSKFHRIAFGSVVAR